MTVLHQDGTPVMDIPGLPFQIDLLAGKHLGLVVLHADDLGLDLAQKRVSDFMFDHGQAPQNGLNQSACRVQNGAGYETTLP